MMILRKTKKMIRRIPCTKEMIESAIIKAEKLGKLNNSITGGVGNIAGYLGEEAVASYLGSEFISDSFNHDQVLKKNSVRHLIRDSKRDKTLEVKTKRRTVAPRSDYDASIAETSIHQQPDSYVFVSLQFDFSFPDQNKVLRYKHLRNIWILGQKEREDYFRIARFYRVGDIDPSNRFKVKANMYNVAVKDLDDIGDL